MDKLFAVFLVTGLVSINSFGQDDLSSDVDFAGFYGDEDFVSIATGVVQPIAKAPAVASVITAQQIQSMGARDIDQVLETVPGLHVSRSAIDNPLYIFRGIHADFNPQVLMLINGIPITNLFQGDRNLVWGGMPVEAIARIEVIRGPGSALYGADAFAGVINIVTKGPEEIENSSAGATIGDFGTRQFWLSAEGEKGELAYSAVIGVGETDGTDEVIESDAQSFLDFLSGTSVSNAPGSVNRSAQNIDIRLEALYKKNTP